MSLDEEQRPQDNTESNTQDETQPQQPAASSEPLAWMNDTLEWGIRARPGSHGLTMRDLNIGSYGDIPESSADMSRRPRGAFPIPGVPRTDLYALSAKVDLWADNAVDLYEEAIQRRWMGHLEIAWDDITPQPYEYELAMRQLCTELAQQASIETDLIGQWLHKMNYAYHEVKTFLASEIFDTGRHYSIFRRRALHNDGSLGMESAGQFNRRMIETRPGWTEVAMFLYLVRGPLTLLLYRYGEAYARNRADKFLFRKCLEDKARHLAYGMAHIRYAVEHQPEGFGRGLGNLMRGVERDLVRDLKDPVLWEALAIIIGGSVANIAQGMAVVDGFKQRYIEDYLGRMQWVGIDKTEANMAPDLAAFLRREETAPAGD